MPDLFNEEAPIYTALRRAAGVDRAIQADVDAAGMGGPAPQAAERGVVQANSVRLHALHKQLQQYRELGRQIHALASSALVGAYVTWDHGGRLQEGCVADVQGVAGNTHVLVHNLNTGKYVRQSIWNVTFWHEDSAEGGDRCISSR